jgi:hypothetical protein
MSTCKFIYNGQEYNENDIKDLLENEVIESAQYNLTDYKISNRDVNIAKAFRLNQLSPGRYLATPKQLDGLRKWTTSPEVKGVGLYYKPYYTYGESLYEVSFSSPQANITGIVTPQIRAKQLRESEQQETIQKTLDRMSEVFPGLKVSFVNPQDLVQSEHGVNVDRINGFFKNGTVYLVNGRANTSIAIEEVLHPFVNALYSENRSLFDQLLRTGKQLDIDFYNTIANRYKNGTGYTALDINKEFVTQMLQRAVKQEFKENETRPANQFTQLMEQFFGWLKNLISEIVYLVNSRGNRVIDISKLPEKMTFENLAVLINTAEVEFYINYNQSGTAYNLDEAKQVNDLFNSQPDENLRRSNTQFKLDRINSQIDTLKNVLSNSRVKQNAKQVETIQKLLDNAEKNAKFFRDSLEAEAQGRKPLESVSVSGFIGSSEFTTVQDYTDFKEFGTFMHSILEEVQEAATKENKRLREILSKEKFEEVLEKYRKKNPFQIQNLKDEEMFEMALQVIDVLGSNVSASNIILPELTVGASVTTSETGRTMMLGRLDMVVIDITGQLHIVDFKTKKVKQLVVPQKDGTTDFNINRVYKELANNKIKINSTNGTAVEFQGQKRSTYDTWNAQLLAYEYMLRQNGINVGKKEIIALIYQADINKIYQGFAVQKFEGNFYEYAGMVNIEGDNRSAAFSEIGAREYDKIKKVVSKYVEIGESEESGQQVNEERMAFDMTPDQYNAFTNSLKKAVSDNIDALYAERSSLKSKEGYEEEIDTINKRIETLKTFRDIIEKGGDVTASLKFARVVEQMDIDINNMLKNFKDALTISDEVAKSRKILVYKKMLDNTREIMRLVENQINRAEFDGKIEKTGYMYQVVKDLSAKIDIMQADYREYAVPLFVKMIQSTFSEKTFEAVGEDMRLALEPKIKKLEEEIQNLINGVPLKGLDKLKLKALKYLNKEAYNEVMDKLDPSKKGIVNAIEVKQLELKRLKLIYETGFNYDTESIKKVIEGTTDPDSILYIGASNPKLISFLGISPDQFISSAGNSDLAIAAFTNFLKDSQAEAQASFINDIQQSELQTLLENFRRGRSVESMNALVSEIRTIQSYNENGEPASYQVATYVKPSSESYDNKFNVYRQQLKAIRTKIDEVKKERDKAAQEKNKEAYEKLKLEVASLIREKENITRDHTNWMRENSSLPYIDVYYEYLSKLSPEIKEKLELLYMEREVILDSVGFGNEELIDEEDFDRMREIDIEIKKLRNDAAKQDAQYQEYIDALNTLFVYDINQNLFDRVYNRKKLEYANNPEMLRKWEEENMVTVPNTAYFEALESIYSEIESITEGLSNPELKNLFERRRQIMSPYKRDGQFDPRYLSEKDRNDLDAITQEIENLKEANKSFNIFRFLTDEESQRLRDLSAELRNISTQRLNKFYEQEREERKNNLLRAKSAMDEARTRLEDAIAANDNIRIETSSTDLAFAEVQFQAEEKLFAKWYNQHHYTPYVSIVEQDLQFAATKLFLYDRVPGDPQYMEKRPSSKYTIRKLSEEAYNKDYQELADGTPLPKGLKLVNGVVEIIPGYENSDNINSKYVNLSKDKAAFDYYNAFMKMFFDMQKKTTGKVLGYKVPASKATLIENIVAKGFGKGISGELSKMRDNFFAVRVSEEDAVTNLYGDMGPDAIRFRFNDQYNTNLQTVDAINAGAKWLFESYINQAMTDVQPTAEHILNLVGDFRRELEIRNSNTAADKKRIQDLSKLEELLQFEKRKFISGQYEEDTNRRAKKALNGLFKIASFGRLGFDVAAQFKNFMSGNIQAFLATHNSGHYGVQDYRWAKSQIYGYNGFFRKYLSDWGKLGNLSVETMMYRMYNPAQKDYIKYLNLTTGSKSRRVAEKFSSIQELAYALQDKGDTEVSMTVWLAVMNSYKFAVIDPITGEEQKDENGDTIMVSAYEAYTQTPDGKLIIRSDVNFTKDDEKRLRRIVYSESRRAQGAYAKSDMTSVEQTLVGKMMYFFKKYLVPQAINRLGNLRANWEGEEAAMGYWRALLAIGNLYSYKEMGKHLLLGGFSPRLTKNSPVNAFYSRKAAQASKEFYAGIMLTALSLLLLSYVRRKKDDDEELGMWEGNAIRLIWGLKQETASLTPLPGIGSFDEYLRNFSQVTNLVNDGLKLYKTSEHLAAYMLMGSYDLVGADRPDPDDDSIMAGIFRRGTYQRRVGFYEKDTPKLYKDIADLTGYKNVRDFFDPNYRISIMQKSQ